MIQRAFLRHSRAFSSRSSLAACPSISSGTHPHRTPLRSSRYTTAARCYTTTAEATNGAEGEASAAESTQAETKEEDPVKKELEAKNREVIDLKDKYLRAVADFRNLQERTKRDMQAANNFAIQ
ncbi:MAG: Mitochondrial matrix cochaperone, partial [Pleopsidium flavum]